jgi:hypothetical protein
MSVNNRQMSVSAKLKHFMSSLIDQSDASAGHQPYLYHPSRDIVIAEVLVEAVETFATAGVFSLSDGTDIDAFGGIDVGTLAGGSFTTLANFTRGVKRVVPAGTKCIPYHTQVAANGTGYTHIWYYLGDNKSDMEVN